MKERWAFFLSLAMAMLAICSQWWYLQRSGEAKRQLTEYWFHVSPPDNPPTAQAMAQAFKVAQTLPAQAQLGRAMVAFYLGFLAAVMSGFCLRLSRRRKEAGRRWIVGALLFYYFLLFLV